MVSGEDNWNDRMRVGITDDLAKQGITNCDVVVCDVSSDPDRPVIGSVIHAQGKIWQVCKVDYTTVPGVMAHPEPPDRGEYDSVLARSHKEYPFFWIVWVNQIHN